MSDATNQVLEFQLGDETYCVSIDYVTEIVDVGELTSVPNAPPHVEGVMDLRGHTTSIVNPKVVFDIDGGDPSRIIVFDPEIADDEQGAVGWLVDEVHQVSQVDPENVDRSPTSDDIDSVRGVVKRDGGFVIWVNPDAIRTA
ncbi:Chemotaxis signal transduction protein [Halapricum desulfuricans]|uniref:Chemotaxis signal transduction protein n=1 Tax=Halapricum desulfuricans TaxID=2841257 RepID=A0A897NHD5_9EURY|nr:chemotaxis protein CheW [Halapricum desulfuricans]QSG10855.1 Chemotaxis signal transduction protein [Halapricum desulfuricans]